MFILDFSRYIYGRVLRNLTRIVLLLSQCHIFPFETFPAFASCCNRLMYALNFACIEFSSVIDVFWLILLQRVSSGIICHLSIPILYVCVNGTSIYEIYRRWGSWSRAVTNATDVTRKIPSHVRSRSLRLGKNQYCVLVIAKSY